VTVTVDKPTETPDTATTTPTDPTRLAPKAAPYAAIGALILAAAGLHAAKEATEHDALFIAATAATTVVIAVVAAATLNLRLDDKKAAQRATAFTAVAAVWLPVVTATGVTLNAVGVLTALGLALSLHWFRKRRIPNNTPTRPKNPMSEPYTARWVEHIACQGGPLPGSQLRGWQPIPAGDRYTLALVPGRQSINTIFGVLENIRTGLGLRPEHDMIVEAHPVLASSHIQFTIVTRSPVRESQVWPGPGAFNQQTGRVNLGPFTDGEGVASWKAYTDNRLWGGFLAGGTGSGKSRMLESVAFSLAASDSHPTVIFFADGQGGSSSPLMVKSADLAAITHEAIHSMLAGMYLVMRLRQDENLIEDREGFAPTIDRPGLLAFIDECHKPLSKIENPELAEHTQYLAATIAREGGKVGVGIVLASQESTLGAFGGAGNLAEMLRSNLLMGNGIILRSKDANAKQVFGVDISPKSFPELAGYAFCVDREPGGRSAPFRGYYVTDEQRQYWPGRIDWKSLDRGAGNAYGPDYGRRREVVTAAKEAARLRVEARRAGRPIPDDLSERATQPPTAQPAAVGFNIINFPTWQTTAADNTDSRPAAELHKGHRAVLDQIASGITSPAALANATGYSERQIHNLLDELMDDHTLVERAKRGTYVLTKARETRN